MIWNRDPWEAPRMVAGESVVAIFAIDPGGTTGWCFGLIEVDGGDWRESIRSAVRKGFVRHGQEATFPLWAEEANAVMQDRAVVGSLYEMEWKASMRIMDRIYAADRWVERKSTLPGLSHVVCEDFIIRIGSTNRNLLSPVRLTTAIYNGLASSGLGGEGGEGGLSEGVAVDFHLQSPSDKSIVTDSVLRDLDLYWPGKPHACDAARHMVLALSKMR